MPIVRSGRQFAACAEERFRSAASLMGNAATILQMRPLHCRPQYPLCDNIRRALTWVPVWLEASRLRVSVAHAHCENATARSSMLREKPRWLSKEPEGSDPSLRTLTLEVKP